MSFILNKVQQAAHALIREDARYIYTIMDMSLNAKNINTNYILMALPYIGIFVDGTEQWCKKLNFGAPEFNSQEKKFYTEIRQKHKLFEKGYDDYFSILLEKLSESEKYFHSNRSILEKMLGYRNVGTDLCVGEFCGNTVLCSMYLPVSIFENQNVGYYIRDMSRVAGRLVAFISDPDVKPYKYNDKLIIKYKDYHFFNSSPLKMNSKLGFFLFSLLCSINYVVEFIENYFIDEIPQKFKFAYLQYYYLCDFIKEFNERNDIRLDLDNELYDRKFRNCIAHYGLGQFISENELIADDPLKGLTNKAFGQSYQVVKENLYGKLRNLTAQIKELILK